MFVVNIIVSPSVKVMYVGYEYILLLNTHFRGFTCGNKRVAKFGQAKRQVGLSFLTSSPVVLSGMIPIRKSGLMKVF